MKKWIVQTADGVLHRIGSSKAPNRADYIQVLVSPENLADEDPKWLQIENIDDGTGNLVPTVTINEVEKVIQQDLDNERAIAKANAETHEEKIKVKLARQEFGKVIKAEVAVLNDSLGQSVAQVVAYMQNRTVQQLDALASSGSLQTLLETMTAADLSVFYTAEQKQGIIDLIQNYLDNE